jgi:hypothetical protein
MGKWGGGGDKRAGEVGKGCGRWVSLGADPSSQMARQVPPTGLESQVSEPSTGEPLQSCAALSQMSGPLADGPHS